MGNTRQEWGPVAGMSAVMKNATKNLSSTVIPPNLPEDCFTHLYYSNCDECKCDIMTATTRSNVDLIVLIVVESLLICALLFAGIWHYVVKRRGRFYPVTHV